MENFGRKASTTDERGSTLMLMIGIILIFIVLPVLLVLAKLSTIQTRAAYQGRVNQEDRLNSEQRIMKMISFSGEEHKQDHYNPDIITSGDGYMWVDRNLSSGTARVNHLMTIESKSASPSRQGMGHLAVIHYVSNYLRFGFVSNGSVTIDAASPLANGTYLGGMWVMGDLTVTAPINFSSGSVVVGGSVAGNGALTLLPPAQMLYGMGATGVVGGGSTYRFIPLDLLSITPMGELSDYFYRYATTSTVVNTTVTFQSDGSIQFDRGALGISVMSVPANRPVVVVSTGATLFLQGDVRRPYTIVSSSLTGGESQAVVTGNLTYHNLSTKSASSSASLAVLADRLIFQNPLAGPIAASGFYYGRTAVQVESPTSVRGVVYSANGIITSNNGSKLDIVFDTALTTGTPHFLPEKPETVNFNLQKPPW